MPNHKNTTAVSIKKNTLKIKIFTKEKNISGDIFTLIMEIKNIDFPSANKFIHKILNLKFTYNFDNKKEKKKDILDIFKKAKESYNKSKEKQLDIYNEDICDEFVNLPYIGWIREGIMPYTQKKFNIGYSLKRNRIVIPHRFWCGKKNDYVGIMGRTLVQNYDILEIPKYFPLIKFPKSMNLYGLQENYNDIQKAGKIIVFESEKSVLKCDSLLCKFAVALGGHELSNEQIKILISLNVEIIFAMDNDMLEQLSIDMCNRVKYCRATSYIYDKYGLLDEKDSPVDRGFKIFKSLLKHRIKIK